MNPRVIVIVLLTMVTAVNGYTVVQNFGDLPLDPSSGIVSVQGR